MPGNYAGTRVEFGANQAAWQNVKETQDQVGGGSIADRKTHGRATLANKTSFIYFASRVIWLDIVTAFLLWIGVPNNCG